MKWSAVEKEKLLPFWVADMDFNMAPTIKSALLETINNHSFGGYSKTPDELSQVMTNKLQEDYNWSVDPACFIWKNGMIPFINIICRTLAGNKGKVLVPVPIYYHLFNAPDWGNQITVEHQLQIKDGHFTFDWPKLEEQLSQGVKLVNLCSPHNPGGRVWPKQDLLQLAQLCQKYEVLICSDEIHCDLLLDKNIKHYPIASLSPAIANQTITLMACSKTYNIPNFGPTLCIVQNEEIREKIISASNGLLVDPSVLGVVAVYEALTTGKAWREALLEYLRQNRQILADFFAQYPQFEMMHPQATYLAWIKWINQDPEKLNDTFNRWGLKVSDGKVFRGPGHFRLNFACPQDTLKKGLDLIAQGLK